MIGGTEQVAIRCRVNGALGADQDYEIKPAEKKKKVVVVGGGPAGMGNCQGRSNPRAPGYIV